MGITHASISLKNPRQPELRPYVVETVADTGAITLCLPQHVALQLQLGTLEMREVTTTDEKKSMVPYAGPVQGTFENRNSFSGALIMGDEVLFGAIQMEDMDLIVMPRAQRVIVNPESPNIPNVPVK